MNSVTVVHLEKCLISTKFRLDIVSINTVKGKHPAISSLSRHEIKSVEIKTFVVDFKSLSNLYSCW